jgi:hypothetical protein
MTDTEHITLLAFRHVSSHFRDFLLSELEEKGAIVRGKG